MIDSALGWIGQIVGWIGAFIPKWVIIDTTEGGIMYVRGSRVKVCSAGIHWYWPAFTSFVSYPTARQSDRLETQTMETTDGKNFIASGTITYCVDDLGLLIPRTHSPMTTIVDLAMTAVHDVCCKMTWEGLQSEQKEGTLKTKLRNSAAKQLEEYGVRVLKLQLNTLARCRVIKISQSNSQEEN